MTLEEVALQAATLAERVTEVFAGQVKLADRVAAVETAIAPTPTPTPTAARGSEAEHRGDERGLHSTIFSPPRRYGEFDGEIVEAKGQLLKSETTSRVKGCHSLQLVLFPVYCPLARIADDELIALRRDDPIVVKGKFVIVDEILMLFFMEGCEIVEWEELGGGDSK